MGQQLGLPACTRDLGSWRESLHGHDWLFSAERRCQASRNRHAPAPCDSLQPANKTAQGDAGGDTVQRQKSAKASKGDTLNGSAATEIAAISAEHQASTTRPHARLQPVPRSPQRGEGCSTAAELLERLRLGCQAE
jgi:hypothetical protein